MPQFQYTGRTASGEAITGELDAASQNAAAGQLLGRGVTPITIEQVKDVAAGIDWSKLFGPKKVGYEDLIIFSRQMYSITRSGIPIMRGIRSLSESIQHPVLKETLQDIGDRLESGVNLSVAMAHHPKVFNELFISLIRVGESSGRLESAFEQLAEYIDRENETIKKIKSALRYPSFVLIALVIAMVVINIFVIPAFADMFAKFGADLPLPTRILMSVSEFFVNYWPYMLLVVVGAFIAIFQYLKTDEGARHWGRWKLSIPLVGSIVERASMARYARSFALMIDAGVPLTKSLDLCSSAIDNPFMGDKIIAIREGVERGESLLRTHKASEMFTPLVLQMVAVGEESGQVDKLLAEVAEYYEREVDYDVSSLSAKIEPIIIVAMAGFVLVLALGIFLPMWSVYEVQGG